MGFDALLYAWNSVPSLSVDLIEFFPVEGLRIFALFYPWIAGKSLVSFSKSKSIIEAA